MTELFAQGDEEVALGLPATYHRVQTTVPQAQIGFIDYVLRPLWAKWDELIGVPHSLQTVTMEENRHRWSLKN
jgi:hypothetical protein